MGALQDIEALISNTSQYNQVKFSGDYWWQETGGIEDNGVWSDEPAGGWVVQNNLDIYINDVVIFGRTEEQIVDYSPELYKGRVIEDREVFLQKMLSELIALGY